MPRHEDYQKAKSNPRNDSRRWWLVLAVLVLGVSGAAYVRAHAPAEKMAAPSVTFTWSAPTTGSAVAHYRAEVLVNDREVFEYGPLNGERLTVQVAYGNKYQVRVAAVDAAGIQGPMSVWSEPYSPELDPPVFLP
jgi:hypothetical protein